MHRVRPKLAQQQAAAAHLCTPKLNGCNNTGVLRVRCKARRVAPDRDVGKLPLRPNAQAPATLARTLAGALALPPFLACTSTLERREATANAIVARFVEVVEEQLV